MRGDFVAPVGRSPLTASRLRKDRAITVAGTLAGSACGLRWALPLPDPNKVCPAVAEGRVQCEMNKLWLMLGVRVLFCALAATLLLRLALSAKALWQARSEGVLVGPPVAPMPEDPVLRAASWNRVYEVTGQTRVLRRSHLAWSDPGPLPVGSDGRLRSDELGHWLARA